MQEMPNPSPRSPLKFPQPLICARFERREKRFFIYATRSYGDDQGGELVAHTNNTGRMTGCLHPGGTVWLSPAENPARKLKWSLEIVETPDGVPVGVNTALANLLVTEAITAGLLPDLAGFPVL
jgi:sugar fermentation stimulation protein A